MSTSTVTASSLVELEAEVCALAAAMHSYRARMLELIAQIDANGAWIVTGATSTVDWLAKLLDLERCTAREHVRVARALRDLPATKAALDNGDLSYAKARHLTRVAAPENEAELLALAAAHPAAALPAVLAAWQHENDPAAARARQLDERALRTRTDVTGNRTTTLTLPPEQAAVFEAALDAEMRSNPSASADASGSHPSMAQQRADAFCRLIRRALCNSHGASADASGSNRGLRVELILHRRVGEETLLDGTPLPPAAAELLLCDADLRIMTHYPDGSPADLGRRQHTVSRKLRLLALEKAGYRCEVPRCGAREHLHVHHKQHWTQGGRTDLRNLEVRCGLHHDRAHPENHIYRRQR